MEDRAVDTPICAGACAQILEYARHLNVALTPAALKEKLELGAEFRNEWMDNKKAYGSGYINVEETIKLLGN